VTPDVGPGDSGEPIQIPPESLEGVILDLVSVAESLREKGDEVNAAIINMVIDQLDVFMPE
jgi:hypothetical protein